MFARSRSATPFGLTASGDSGVLRLPRCRDGSKCAWIVDGQQRSTALARAGDVNLPVPVISFVSDDLHVHREQFILVNKALPLPNRMLDYLLPVLYAMHLPPFISFPACYITPLNSLHYFSSPFPSFPFSHIPFFPFFIF